MPAMITHFSGVANTAQGGYIFNNHNPAHALLNDLEIEVVIMLERTTSNGPIIGYSAYEANSYEQAVNNILYSLRINARKVEISHEYGNGSNYTVASTQEVPVGRWVRIKMIRSGFTYFVYVDGVLHLQTTFTSAQSPTIGTPLSTQGALRLGLLYTEAQTTTRANTINICFATVKNESGAIVYQYGQDPGGSPGVAPLELGGVLDVDSFVGLFERPPQIQKGMDEIEPNYLLLTRGPQRTNAYLMDPIDEGPGGGGSEPIQTPRAFPLETQWTRANASQLE